ncbi:MAG: hypothetical protein Q4F85_04590 [Prevotella sp.]|nr:hypothetical protein [Prevotella sp.]
MTDKKRELLALLPNEVQKSKELTTSAKLILANIIQWYGTDYAMENKSCYRTNIEMMKDTDIKSENSIISGTLLLQKKGLISRERGERGKASTYILNIEALKSYTENRPINSNCGNNNTDNETALLRTSIGEMKSEICSLKNTIEELKTAILIITSKLNCSTDIETDKEIDIPVYGKESNEVHSDDDRRIEVMTGESDTLPNDALDVCPIDSWEENADIEAWAEQYGNDMVHNNTSNFKEWNAEITEVFKKLEEYITLLFHSRNERESIKLQAEIEAAFQWCNDNRGKFTDRQFNKVQVQCRRWQSVVNAKVRYFNNGKNKCQATAKDKKSPIIPSLEQVTEDTKQPIDIISGRTAITGVSNDDCKWKERVDNSNCSVTDEFPLNETTLCFENMTKEQRRYFTASPFELNEQDEPLRYIRAYKWLRNPGDADRLFGTFYERVIAIVGKDIKAQERYINEWNRYCEQAA